ncbi:hypothetical protein LZ30DRAFT_415990 [Colletotrichum cereale]|nr:hypothetical protein LZ30DRAFT_415990 [Colletotrichum cereale]
MVGGGGGGSLARMYMKLRTIGAGPIRNSKDDLRRQRSVTLGTGLPVHSARTAVGCSFSRWGGGGGEGERGSGPGSINQHAASAEHTRCSVVGLSCIVEERPGSGPTSDKVMDGGKKLGLWVFSGLCGLVGRANGRVVSEERRERGPQEGFNTTQTGAAGASRTINKRPRRGRLGDSYCSSLKCRGPKRRNDHRRGGVYPVAGGERE